MPGRRSESGQIAEAESLRRKAFALLARRDRSRIEMERLLERCCEDRALIAQVLDDLAARGWLSDARLAAQLVASRRHRAGAMRIRQEMARRGLRPEAIAAAATGLEAGDLEAALALWRRRFGTVAADRAGQARQLRFLVNRGFSHGLALKVLRISGQEAGEESD